MNIAIIGMGGFAGAHHDAVKLLESQGECKLVCTCDPAMGDFVERQEKLEFESRGVRLFNDYRLMLDECGDKLDVVTIPTPVPLHASMHRDCVERGLAVYLEKPPTLNYAELEEMLAVEQAAKKETMVGFNFIVDSNRRALKKRILEGEFGKLQRVCLQGLWIRSTSYYRRATWAGRLMLDGKLVLDCCIGNAMAHFAHNVLFWSGQGEVFSWGQIKALRAELYRAHRIQGADTVFVQAEIENGPEVRIAMSHACQDGAFTHEWVECENATITYAGAPLEGPAYEIKWKDGRVETGTRDEGNIVARNIKTYLDYVRGDFDRPLTRLIDSKPFVYLNDLLYVASGKITTIDHSHLMPVAAEGEYAPIINIREIGETFTNTGKFPSEQGISWAVPGGKAKASEIDKLLPVVEKMAKERGEDF